MSLKSFLWFTLYELFKLGASNKEIQISTTDLASLLGVSQQSASRHLQLLETMGQIKRRKRFGGSLISITRKGIGNLEDVYIKLKKEFEEGTKELSFKGIVFSGMLQGKYYITQPSYLDQIKEKLGFIPYPGTLNVRLIGDYMESRRVLEGWPTIVLKGFQSDDRAFGGARCYPLIVNGEVQGALIVADRTGYDLSVMEVISPLNLRKKLNLEDGDIVSLVFNTVEDASSYIIDE
jgi:riboflavin kinase